jgi:hypothetical protein
MVYRVRYQASGAAALEAEVEANSPNEAKVKFSHVHPVPLAMASRCISVSQDGPLAEDLPQDKNEM